MRVKYGNPFVSTGILSLLCRTAQRAAHSVNFGTFEIFENEPPVRCWERSICSTCREDQFGLEVWREKSKETLGL